MVAAAEFWIGSLQPAAQVFYYECFPTGKTFCMLCEIVYQRGKYCIPLPLIFPLTIGQMLFRWGDINICGHHTPAALSGTVKNSTTTTPFCT